MTAIEKIKSRGKVPRAVLYARFSSDNQREESIEAQLRALHEYCQRNGIVVVDEFCDRARSATTDDRPEFLNMIMAAKDGKFDFAIVHKLDRFARNRYDSAYYKHELRKNGVILLSVLENLDDSPESIILESVLEGMSEYYSKNLGREVMKGMKESALQCRYLGGHIPFGYKVNQENHKFEIDDFEANAVKLIFKSVAEGQGYAEITDKLNELGYRTKTGRQFAKNSLSDLLRNEKYRGIYIFNRATSKSVTGKRNNHLCKPIDEMIRVEGGMPKIIDDETFFKVSQILKSRSNRTQNASAKENYLLTGKIFCGECKSAFCGNRSYSGRNKNKRVTYRCSCKSMRGERHCDVKDINRNYLESFILKRISEIIFSEDKIPQLINDYKNAMIGVSKDTLHQLEIMRSNYNSIQKKIDNIISVISQSGSASLLSTLEKLDEEKALLESKIEAAENDITQHDIDACEIISAYRKAQNMFENGTLPQKKQLINLYLNKVKVYNDYVEIELNDIPSCIKRTGNETGLTENSEPCDVHKIILISHKNEQKKSHATKSVRFFGGGEGS